MTSAVTFTIRDYSDKRGRFRLYVPDLTGANFDATIAAITAIRNAIAAATKGNIVGVTLSLDTGLAGADERPTDPFAQNELGGRFFYQDDVTGKKSYFTIPCADLDILGQGGTDGFDLTLSNAAAVVGAIEAIAVSEAGNAITINSGEIAGRSN